MEMNGRAQAVTSKRIALGVCGGVAAYKATEVLRGLQQAGCTVRVALTKHAGEFITPLTFRALSGEHVIVDDYAADNPDPIAHITFSQTVDLLLIAPATANIIAKFAHGIADDFLTSTYLASAAPVVIAPAMNTRMWNHPATQRNLERLRADGVHIVEPAAGAMACGTVGPGRLSDTEKIVAAALDMLLDEERNTRHDLAGEHVVITAGATREEIDPVRFISNRSSGRMGFALAEAACVRGAAVTVIAGAIAAPLPTAANIRIVRVVSAEEMHRAVIAEIRSATVFIAAAAVSDYRPSVRFPDKLKKTAEPLTLQLEPTPDILAEVARWRSSGNGNEKLLVIGFAAETNDVQRYAQEKLHSKHLDLIVANDITQVGAGFDVETNIITIITADHNAAVTLPLLSKLAAAHRVLDAVRQLRCETPRR